MRYESRLLRTLLPSPGKSDGRPEPAGLAQLWNFQRYAKNRKTRFGEKKRILSSLQPFITYLKRSKANIRSSLTKCQNQKKPHESKRSNFHTVKHNRKIVWHNV